MRLPRKLKKRLKRLMNLSPRQIKTITRTYNKVPVFAAITICAARAALRAQRLKQMIRYPKDAPKGTMIAINKGR